LIQAHGFQVARYVSLERLIEQSKEDYSGVLAECSQGWHEGQNDLISWWNYFLSALRRAYQEFARQVESTGARPAKSDLVGQTVLAQVEQFTLGDLAAQLPSASTQLIKKILAELKFVKTDVGSTMKYRTRIFTDHHRFFCVYSVTNSGPV
jgi:Fic family protein